MHPLKIRIIHFFFFYRSNMLLQDTPSAQLGIVKKHKLNISYLIVSVNEMELTFMCFNFIN